MSEVWIVTNKRRGALDDEREIAFSLFTALRRDERRYTGAGRLQ